MIETDRLIGEVRLDRIDMQDKRASLAIGILDPDCLGKGLGTEATVLVLGHAFRDLKLHRMPQAKAISRAARRRHGGSEYRKARIRRKGRPDHHDRCIPIL
ncbi:MAG: N-acetyltransferase [Mesorhizobium sp.]|nr:MAG: N-acetyltransferase [Mesorhizobium sp.]